MQVARNEARGQAQVAQDLHQQPARVAAGTATQRQRFFGRLHARFHADQIFDLVLNALVQRHQKIDGADFGLIYGVDQGLQQRGGRLGFQKRLSSCASAAS